MATVAATKHKAGRLLGIVRYGQALGSDDSGLLGEAYTQEYDKLKELGLAVWASAGTVPDRVMPHLAAMMARNVGADKSVSNERWIRILQLDSVALKEIQMALTPAYESVDEPVDY